MSGLPARALETVEIETPDILAMSAIFNLLVPEA
jgi:hypothetical protein